MGVFKRIVGGDTSESLDEVTYSGAVAVTAVPMGPPLERHGAVSVKKLTRKKRRGMKGVSAIQQYRRGYRDVIPVSWISYREHA
tara:strand:+ start:547 stop:798 length:252 start_codon:yes stop_codon:yes gene_type:complete